MRVCGPLFLQVPRSTLTLLRGPSFTLTSWVALLPCRAFDPWHRQALCGSHSFRGLLLCGALGKPEAHPWDSENSLCLFAECSWHRLLWLADKKTTLPLADGVFPCAFYCARRLLSAEARLMLPLLVAQPACPDPAQPPQALLGFFSWQLRLGVTRVCLALDGGCLEPTRPSLAHRTAWAVVSIDGALV